MAMGIWKLVFFEPLRSQLTLTCLQFINTERQNEIIDTRFIRAIVQSYVELDFDEDSSVPYYIDQITSSRLKIYKDNFEVEQRFQVDIHRVESYLHSSTLAPLIKKLEQIFILDQLEPIYTEAKTLLHNENYSHFAFLFKLVGRIPNTIIELKKIVEENFCPKVIKSITPISVTAIDASTNYVESILNIREEFFKVVQEFFHNDEHFIAAVEKTCRNFINNNVLPESADNAGKSAELLARYCDKLLRKGSEIDNEGKFDQIMIGFDYVKDKDVFEKFYYKMLFKRLLCGVRKYEYSEESMILRLKTICDLTYISKLQELFQGGNISKTLLDQYRLYCEKNKINDIVINILN
ncbi:unnamed protein product [Rotaria sordida]|uniref:Cullin family profile domain-containing protein n=1 Tax=Rotaria sordida TaxID=392033 RepID=A0A818V483_9BILA|nr:unnamed protein product [Rotaria sordida]CAF3709946.1 unnamed protein product [Rotaria sordida]